MKSSQNLHGGSVSEAKVISESIIIGPGGGGGGRRLFVFRLVWMGTLLKSKGA